MMIKDIQFEGVPDSVALTKTINGQLNPRISMQPGEFQFWRMGNIGANAFANLKLDGHTFWIFAQDGNILEQPLETETLFLPPSSRMCVMVKASAQKGDYTLRSLEVNRGPAGNPNPEVVLATVSYTHLRA